MRIKKQVKELILILMTILGVMGAGYLMLVLSYLIPNKAIYNNVADSAQIIMSQGVYPKAFLDKDWWLDNWTDADCISITYNESSSNPFYNALNAFQLAGKDNLHAGGVDALWSTVHGDIVQKGDHTHLWHGYRIWLKPLLLKYNITSIRCLCHEIIIFLMISLCIILIIRKNNVLVFIPFLMAFIVFNFQLEAMSLLFFNDFAVTLAGCILVAYMSDKKGLEKYYKEVFAGIGAVLAFTSMIILPILTIGFTIIVWLILSEQYLTWKERTIGVIRYSLCWFTGYLITLLTKIIISIPLFSNNNGIESLLKYTGSSAKLTIRERFECIFATFEKIMQISEIQKDMLVCCILLLLVCSIIRGRKKLKRICEYIPYFIVALYPCVWCFVCGVHAGHGWTYFNYSISIFALFSVLFSLSGFERKINRE